MKAPAAPVLRIPVAVVPYYWMLRVRSATPSEASIDLEFRYRPAHFLVAALLVSLSAAFAGCVYGLAVFPRDRAVALGVAIACVVLFAWIWFIMVIVRRRGTAMARSTPGLRIWRDSSGVRISTSDVTQPHPLTRACGSCPEPLS